MMPSAPRWQEFATLEALAETLADRVAEILSAGIRARQGATLAVSGGTTPGRFFDALSRRRLDWAQVIVTLVDERFVPPSSDRSNEKLVRERLLVNEARLARFVPLAPRDLSNAPPPLTLPGRATGLARPSDPLKGERDPATSTPSSPLWGQVGGKPSNPSGDPLEEAARAADAGIALLPRPFDVVALGMGADGHTASFFPDAENLDELTDPAQPRRVLPVRTVAGGEPRLTLTMPLIVSARFLALQIEGAEKRATLERALSDEKPAMPIRRVADAAPALRVYWAP